MQSKIEKFIRLAYRRWRYDNCRMHDSHPGEESLACFLEGRLSRQESEGVKLHLLTCDSCSEILAIQAKAGGAEETPVPAELMQRAKDLAGSDVKSVILEIFLRLKKEAMELINTSGDVLVGQELIPVPILRSRKIPDFKDEVTILKDFKDLRVEVKVENKGGKAFNLNVAAKERQTQRALKDLRITLLKDDLELESYLSDSGSVTFEHVLLGRHRIEISSLEKKIASILLDMEA